MDKQDSLMLVIEKRLDSLGVDVQELDMRTIEQIKQIEVAVENEIALRLAALEEAASHNLSLRSLAAASGISRATFYNKDVLKRYVDLCRCELCPDERSEVERLKVLLAEAKKEIALLKRHDGQYVLTMVENEQLKDRIAALETALQDKSSQRNFSCSGGELRVVSKMR